MPWSLPLQRVDARVRPGHDDGGIVTKPPSPNPLPQRGRGLIGGCRSLSPGGKRAKRCLRQTPNLPFPLRGEVKVAPTAYAAPSLSLEGRGIRRPGEAKLNRRATSDEGDRELFARLPNSRIRHRPPPSPRKRGTVDTGRRSREIFRKIKTSDQSQPAYSTDADNRLPLSRERCGFKVGKQEQCGHCRT